MENELLTIGRLADLSGLPVSALRYYDGADVLRPVHTDASSGYRFYDRRQVRVARVLAHLRRVGLPLREVRVVVTHPDQAGPILDAHLRRLEAGLADARREISTVHHLLNSEESAVSHSTVPETHFAVPAAELIGALRDVRYAVSNDPSAPALNGIYLDSEPGRLRLVATDRYRLATSAVRISDEVEVHVLLPTAVVDELLELPAGRSIDVDIAAGEMTLTTDSGSVTAHPPETDFPPYRRWLELGSLQVPIDAPALSAALGSGESQRLTRENDGVEYDAIQLSVTADGVRVGTSEDAGARVVAVNREFFAQALATGEQLILGFDDPISPLAIRDTAREGAVSILMPVRLDETPPSAGAA